MAGDVELAAIAVGAHDARRDRAAGQARDQRRRGVERRPHLLRIDAALEAIRRLREEAEPSRRPPHARRREEGALEEHRGRPVAHLGFLPAHHAGERDGAAAVGDDQIVRLERARHAVERRERARRPPARRTTMRPPRTRARSKACSGWPRSSIT